MNLGSPKQLPPVGLWQALALRMIGIVTFHLAYAFTACRFGMVIFFYCLVRLAGLRTPRKVFYAGLVIGLAIYSPQLGFFWSLFGFPAVTLWTVLAFWIGLFVLLVHLCQRQFG